MTAETLTNLVLAQYYWATYQQWSAIERLVLIMTYEKDREVRAFVRDCSVFCCINEGRSLENIINLSEV